MLFIVLFNEGCFRGKKVSNNVPLYFFLLRVIIKDSILFNSFGSSRNLSSPTEKFCDKSQECLYRRLLVSGDCFRGQGTFLCETAGAQPSLDQHSDS